MEASTGCEDYGGASYGMMRERQFIQLVVDILYDGMGFTRQSQGKNVWEDVGRGSAGSRRCKEEERWGGCW
jgi:hypothetical protein